MGKLLVVILILIIFSIVWSLPLWIVVNLVCWVFHLSFHLTILQSFALCLLATTIKRLLFTKEDK